LPFKAGKDTNVTTPSKQYLVLPITVIAVSAAFIVIVAILVIQKDSPLGEYMFSPFDKVDVTVKAIEFKKVDIQEMKVVFFYFEYQVKNTNPKAIQFDPGTMRLKVNSVTNSQTHYHSIASAVTEPIPLSKGESAYYLYGVYPADINRQAIESLSLEDAGFSLSALENLRSTH
jgi:hypothetical protein